MKTLRQQRASRFGAGSLSLLGRLMALCGLAGALSLPQARAQDDQLNKIHVEPPSSTSAGNNASEPKGTEGAPETGAASLKIHPGSFIRMNVDMVLVPVTITDPLNRLVTGLEKEDFQVYENNEIG